MFGGLLQHEKKPGSISISNESHDKNENLLRGDIYKRHWCTKTTVLNEQKCFQL